MEITHRENSFHVNYAEVDGIKFYKSAQGYWIGQVEGKPKRLHIYIWEKHNGPVPAGYHIHHIDGDKDNNEIENLTMLSRFEHQSLHGKTKTDKQSASFDEKVRPLSSLWHKSEEGRSWHRKHYEETMRDQWEDKIVLKCQVCGKEFETPRIMRDKAKFCSNACKAKYRRDSGVDNVTKVCPICGKEFQGNKYASAKFCGKECRSIARIRHIKV